MNHALNANVLHLLIFNTKTFNYHVLYCQHKQVSHTISSPSKLVANKSNFHKKLVAIGTVIMKLT